MSGAFGDLLNARDIVINGGKNDTNKHIYESGKENLLDFQKDFINNRKTNFHNAAKSQWGVKSIKERHDDILREKGILKDG